MQKNILITGKPKSGKSTLLKGLITDIPNKTGFVTNEILGESGRVGFEIETRTGRRTMLARVDSETPYKVSKYFVNVSNLDAALSEISDFDDNDLLYLDEIGQMQLFSDTFKRLALHYLDSENTCVATLSYVFEDDFTRSIRERDDVILIEISTENHEEREKFITQLLQKIAKARKYISEPDRFTKADSRIELQSAHGTRILTLTNGGWNCTCDFFKQYGICSHAIATSELAGQIMN